MRIYADIKWVVVDPDDADFEKLKSLGWTWRDAHDPQNDHPLKYGHFWTVSAAVLERTRKAYGVQVDGNPYSIRPLAVPKRRKAPAKAKRS